MKVINTTRFGTIEVEEDKIFEFVQPILGFDQLKYYVLIDHAPDSPFKWLQSTEEPDIAFIVTNPINFGIEYEFTLQEDDTKKLSLVEADDALVFTIVYIPQGAPHLMTTNLAGPIVINTSNRVAIQVVLSDSKFTTKHRLLPNEDSQKSKSS